MDFLDWEIDEHTCDLWCFVFTGNLFYVFIDELSYLTLVVGVLWNNSWEYLVTLLVVLNNMGWELLVLGWHHLLLLGWDSHGSWHHLLRHSHLLLWHAAWVHSHWWLSSKRGWHLTWLHLWLWHVAWLVVLSLLVWASLTTTLSVVVVVHATLSVESLGLSLEMEHEVLNKLIDLGSVHDVHVEGSWVLLLEVLIVSLVSDLLLLKLSVLLQFVVVDVELLSVEGLLVELLFGKCSTVWVLVADECIECFSLLW